MADRKIESTVSGFKREGSHSLEADLLSGGNSLVRRGYSAILKNCGKLIAALTALIVLLVTFTEVGFYEIGATELTANLLLLLVASYVIYFSLEDAGERLGRESEEYKAAKRRQDELTAKITSDMMPALREYVEDYRERELSARRAAILIVEGLCEDDLNEEDGQSINAASGAPKVDAKGKRQSRAARAAIRRARAQRPIDISAGMLLSGGSRRGRELYNPERTKFLSLVIRLIPTTVCTLFTASVMLSVKDGLGAGEIIEGLVRLCPLPVVALRGYSAGYVYASEEESEWMVAKSRLIESFLRSQGIFSPEK